jgi:hypothetical protein
VKSEEQKNKSTINIFITYQLHIANVVIVAVILYLLGYMLYNCRVFPKVVEHVDVVQTIGQ